MNRFFLVFIFAFTSFFVGAQESIQSITERFNRYTATWPTTQLQLVFNQDKYSPGDTAWFKTYFLYENLIGVKGKQLLELNLVDFKGESRLRFLFQTNDGRGYNQLVIPEELPSGIYSVTVHSNWMKNFDPALIFKKSIKIVRSNEVEEKDKIILQAAPEGGHLIQGILTKIMIRYKPLSVVQILAADGELVGTATLDEFGFGSHVILPKHNSSYLVKVLGKSDQVLLPAVEEEGCLLSIGVNSNGSIKAKIYSLGTAFRDQSVILVVISKGKVCHTQTIQLTSAEEEILLPTEKLPGGVVHLTLLKTTGDHVTSRDFYHDNGRDRIKASVQLQRNNVHVRENVKVNVSITDQDGKAIEGEFSVSVVNSAVFTEESRESFAHELIPFFPERDSLHDRISSSWRGAVDIFLALSSKSLPWKKILLKNTEQPRHPFTSVIEKMGRVYFSDTMQPVPDDTQVLFYLQKSQYYYQTFTSGGGCVSLTIPDFIGKDEFFYLAASSGVEIPNLTVKWEDESIPLPGSLESIENTVADRYANFSNQKRIIDRSFAVHSLVEEATKDINLIGRFESLTGQPDVKVNVQDYTIFPTMEELIKEIVPSIFHRKTSRGSIVRVQVLSPMSATTDPLYVIDGVVTKNTNFFLSLKPAEIMTIKVVKSPRKLMPLGLLGRSGIIMVQTKSGTEREPVSDSTRLIDGLSLPLEFKTSDSGDQRKPNFRSTLYWNPMVKTDSNGRASIDFYCSDDIGKMLLKIEGLTQDGIPFLSAIPFTVSLEK